MLSYEFLFDIALILMSTKLLGLLTKQIKLPQVVGALLAGLLLGPACLNILHETDFIIQLAELGVIVLMFTAGLETDINELKKTGNNGCHDELLEWDTVNLERKNRMRCYIWA